MAKTDFLTAARLRELLHYDPETGVFTWLVSNTKRVRVGGIAGCTSDHGYIRIAIDGVQHRAHRLAWLYMTGEWPAHQIDHINGTRDDNRIKNLRQATDAQNRQNLRKPRSDNRCGMLGVCANRDRWRAVIQVGGKFKHIGTFDTPELAGAAYLAQKSILHPYQTIVNKGQA